MTAPAALPRLALAAADPAPLRFAGLTNANGVPSARFKKRVLRVGEYRHPSAGWRLSVTPDKLAAFARSVQQQLADGHTVEVTVDHSRSARDVVGKVVGAEVDGDWLILHHELTGENIKLAEAVENVSVEIERDLVDAQGRRYGEAIVASSLVQKPVVPGQGGFERLAASRGTTDPLPVLCLATAPQGNRTLGATEEHAMNDKLKGALLKIVGGETLDEDKAAEALAGLATAKDEAEQAKALVTSLEAELAQAKAAAATKEPKALDKDVADVLLEGAQARMDKQVAEGKLTPAQRDRIAASLLKQGEPTGVLCLSRTHSGTPRSLINLVLDVFELAPGQTLTSTATGPQTLALSRQTPGGSANGAAGGTPEPVITGYRDGRPLTE